MALSSLSALSVAELLSALSVAEQGVGERHSFASKYAAIDVAFKQYSNIVYKRVGEAFFDARKVWIIARRQLALHPLTAAAAPHHLSSPLRRLSPCRRSPPV